MEHLRNLVKIFSDKHPDLKAREEHFEHIENVLLPHLLRVIKRDNTLMSEIELFPGLKVAWDGTDENWSKVHMALVHAVLHGNPKEKFAKILEAVKGSLPGGSAATDEIEKILADEDTQSSITEMMELVMSTRLVTLVGDIMSAVSLDDLQLDDPYKVMDMLQNPQASPVLMELMERAKNVLEEKVRTGKINPNELRRDIERIRAKFQSSFGKYLNDALLGENARPTTGNTSQEILSNHPDARRARMLARLQKKQQQKSGDKK